MKVYPNPAKHFVTVEAEGIKEVSICNALGQCVMQKNVADNQIVIDLKDMAKGLYLFRVKTAEGVVCRRISVVD